MKGVKRTKLVIVGFGSVGRSLARIIAYKRNLLAKKYSITLDVVGVVDSKGMVVKPHGLEEHELLRLCELPRSGVSLYQPFAKSYVDLKELYDETQPDIHVELTPSNYETGEPGTSNMSFALTRGIHVVTANKAPLVMHYSTLRELAEAKKVSLKFGATVMGGTPLVEMLHYMKSREVKRVEGILNATTNFILTEMSEKLVSFEEALQKARIMGVAEANPHLDVEGIDAAAKLVIISHVIGYPVTLENVVREPLVGIQLRDILEAERQGYVLKYIASLDTETSKASVKVKRIPHNDVLAGVKGTLNCVKIATEDSPLVFIGKGGGGVETAHTVLDDVLSIVASCR